MKGIIYYFSGTGNNLALAKGVKKKLLENEIEVDIFPVTRLLQDKKIGEEYELVGFTLPSYYGHMPKLIESCLEGVLFGKEQKIFTIVGCGGNRGLASEDIRESILKAGKSVDYEFMVIMPGNYIQSYGAFPQIYEKTVLAASRRKITKIATILITQKGTRRLGKGFFYFQSMEKNLQNSMAKFSEVGSGYMADENCIRCGACEKVCFAGNIDVTAEGVKFGKNCQQCMACIQWCPVKAIDYKGELKDRKRYHHPDIRKDELAESNARYNYQAK